LRHIGFKDVGVSPAVLATLRGAIRASGAAGYMEVVSTTRRPASLRRTSRRSPEPIA
jgi:hypothetical protein